MDKAISPLERALVSLGGIRETARRLGVTPQAVHQWAHGTRPLPIVRCIAIERATSRVVTVEELRPDVDWATIRGDPASPLEAA